MSRSKPTAKNPATRFFQWGGGDGSLSYYDKEAEERIEVPFGKKKPFVFLVLDELNTMSGFSDDDQSSFWSNEVRDVTKDVMTLRTGKGVKARGVYKDLKDTGAKYAKSVYIAYKDEAGELVIGHIKIMGAALTAWIDFNKKWDVYKVAVKLEDIKAAKKGKVEYFLPVFSGLPVSEATNEEAKALDAELQQYLNTYLSYVPDEEEIVQDDDEEDDAVVEKAATTKKKERKEPEIEDTDIDLGEVPF